MFDGLFWWLSWMNKLDEQVWRTGWRNKLDGGRRLSHNSLIGATKISIPGHRK